MITIEQISKAIRKHCGGFKNATDVQLMAAWNVLPPEQQQEYLNNIKPKGKTDADPIRP